MRKWKPGENTQRPDSPNNHATGLMCSPIQFPLFIAMSYIEFHAIKKFNMVFIEHPQRATTIDDNDGMFVFIFEGFNGSTTFGACVTWIDDYHTDDSLPPFAEEFPDFVFLLLVTAV